MEPVTEYLDSAKAMHPNYAPLVTKNVPRRIQNKIIKSLGLLSSKPKYKGKSRFSGIKAEENINLKK